MVEVASVGRRDVLGRAGLVAAGMVLGGGGEVGRELWHAQSTKADFNASVGCPAHRGAARVFWSAPLPATGAAVGAASRSDGGVEPEGAPEKVMALTFDDGPTTQLTAQALDVLREHDVRATFFMIGECVRRRPELARKVRDAGHEIAGHGFDHVRAPGTPPGDVERSVTDGSRALSEVLGVRPTHFRPPRGELTTVLLHAVAADKQDVVLWSMDRGPGGDGDVDAVRRHLIATAHPGAVVCLHDGIGRSSLDGSPDKTLLLRRRTELAALPGAIDAWRSQGYRFALISDLLPPVGPALAG